jgi:hypothetical protein
VISADPSGSIISTAGNSYSKMYILFNKTQTADKYPVMIGYYDTSKSKIIVNGSFTPQAALAGMTFEIPSTLLNATLGTDTLSYAFRLNVGGSGEQSWYLNVTVGTTGKVIQSMTVGTGATQTVTLGFQNKSDTKWNGDSAPVFQLGVTSASAEGNEVNATTETNVNGVGTATQSVVDDKGVIVVTPSANGAGDKVVVQIPEKTLAAVVYFGKLGAGTSTTGSTYHDIVPITTPVGKLDTDPEMAVGGSGRAKNIVTVGGPCINKITAAAMNLTYPACGATSTIPANQAIIQVVDGAFATGKEVVVVAGWEATNTRTASSVLQQWNTLLSGVTASKVVVTAATTAGITPA